MGKFKEISSVITPLSDNEEIPSNYFELFGIVHGLLMKMITTSRESMAELFTQECKLFVVDEVTEQIKLTKVLIDGCEVYQHLGTDSLTFYLPLGSLGPDKAILNLGKVLSILPVTKVVNEISDEAFMRRLEKLL